MEQATLAVSSSSTDVVEYQLDPSAAGPVTLGRAGSGRHVDVPIDGVDVAFISALHALFEFIGGCWWVRDLSTNGTQLRRKGATTKLAPNRAVALWDGDTVLLAHQHGTAPTWEITYRGVSAADVKPDRSAVAATQVPEQRRFHFDDGVPYLTGPNGLQQIHGLTPMDLRLLLYLYDRAPKEAVTKVRASKTDLIEHLWGDQTYRKNVSDLAGQAYRIRQKIEPSPNYTVLTTEADGYCLQVDTRDHETSSRTPDGSATDPDRPDH